MTRPLQQPLYDNILLLAPNNIKLCFCNRSKAEWYLSRDYAEYVSEDTIRLKFEPKGKGHDGDPFYLTPKKNVCVVCGSIESLTRHHIFPYCFRRYFPDRIKRHNSHDIVPLCVSCHDSYETQADRLKVELGREFGVPFAGNPVCDKLLTVKRHASALFGYRDRIPKDRVDCLFDTLRKHYGKEEITEEEIALAARIKPVSKSTQTRVYGQAIVQKITDLQAFVVRWRKHFLATMKPIHMPEYWSVDRKLQGD